MTLLGQGLADHAQLPALDLGAAEQLAAAVMSERQARRPWLLRLEQLPAGDPVPRCSARPEVRELRRTRCERDEAVHSAPFGTILDDDQQDDPKGNPRGHLAPPPLSRPAQWP